MDSDALTLEIRAATRRGLRHIDPAGRALHLSVGCAVLNLRIAIEHFGWDPVPRLLPRPDEPDLLATVRLGGSGRTSSYTSLYDAVWRRHSSRFPSSERPLPTAVIAELTEAAHAEGARLHHLPPHRADSALRLTRETEHRNTTDTDRAGESRRWVTAGNGTGLGMPSAVLGPQDYRERIPMRDFGAHRHPAVLTARSFEQQPSLAVLSTAHDRRTDWLRASQGSRTGPPRRHRVRRAGVAPAPGTGMAGPGPTPRAMAGHPSLPRPDGDPSRVQPRGTGFTPQQQGHAVLWRRLTSLLTAGRSTPSQGLQRPRSRLHQAW
ncbi:hypothetical protein ACGFXB_33780 [Streptomyces canus]|uniref:hypothetical protein n=1 Tax=Streptomyces canus TaxID=58343 RepID=UPI0037193BF5